MATDTMRSLNEVMRDLYLEPLREAYNNISAIELLLGPTEPAPPTPWWRKRVNRMKWWMRDNVTWRFARHQLECDW